MPEARKGLTGLKRSNEELSGRKKSTCLRRKRKLQIEYNFFCLLISDLHLFVQNQKLELGMVP